MAIEDGYSALCPHGVPLHASCKQCDGPSPTQGEKPAEALADLLHTLKARAESAEATARSLGEALAGKDEQPDFAVYWDGEAKVWIACGGYIKGLVLEGVTLEELGRKCDAVIPNLMQANEQQLRPALQPGQRL